MHRDRPAEFAVDGVVHYAKHLSKSFNVIAIAASGQSASGLKISTFLFPRSSIKYRDLTNERGDGKTNLYQGSCFDKAITKEIKAHKCNTAMLNPSYSQGDADLHELVFVKHALDCIVEGGTAIFIVPMSCAIYPHLMREEILTYHTLDAVMSMPDELFYPVGVVTCIMVFTAEVPHKTSNKKTWFGYWKNDGFIKTKPKGRIDLHQKWPQLRDKWIEQYRNREVHAGECITHYVTHEDEWCAEHTWKLIILK